MLIILISFTSINIITTINIITQESRLNSPQARYCQMLTKPGEAIFIDLIIIMQDIVKCLQNMERQSWWTYPGTYHPLCLMVIMISWDLQHTHPKQSFLEISFYPNLEVFLGTFFAQTSKFFWSGKMLTRPSGAPQTQWAANQAPLKKNGLLTRWVLCCL